VSDRLREDQRALFHGTALGTVVTLGPDGGPHSAPMWIDEDDGDILLNTAAGRVKDRNIAQDPRVVVTVLDPADPYRWVSVEGDVVERTEEGALAHIQALCRRYQDDEWAAVADQVRIIYRIRPRRVYGQDG
jgi:PPOX class probable F420-dependent enzyme